MTGREMAKARRLGEADYRRTMALIKIETVIKADALDECDRDFLTKAAMLLREATEIEWNGGDEDGEN